MKINLSVWGHLSFRPVWVNILSREDEDLVKNNNCNCEEHLTLRL